MTESSTELRLDNRSALVTTGRYGTALAHLALLGASGLTQLVASTHATIARRPHPLQGDSATAQDAPLAYQFVTRSFLWLAALSARLHGQLPAQNRNGRFHSAINGVLGDTLAAHGNPLHQGMSLRNEFGEEVSAGAWQADARRGLVVFVHGLCLSEREWQNHEHANFVRELREFGYGVAWLRYNTGRAIHENGADLSLLLEETNPEKLPLTLIGHSMGGLVIRAASHHAENYAMQWQQQLRHAAYLGTPHQGAPLERLGESANRLLGLTPYTKPFMQIGGLRSNGIQDLRRGRIAAIGKPVQLSAGARHLLIAGHLGNERKMDLLGDGLVPVRSALGQHLEPEKALQGADITRREFPALGHMALLKDARVYSALMEWLKP
ncbi:MAG: alpha/beta fold hydrolase [Pedobacter sp.]|nr:alpha/beta fold hydrolase [Pedobacter sp.]